MGRREAQGHIDANSLGGQRLTGFQSFGNQRDLDNNVLVNLRQVLPLLDHRIGLDADDFSADRPIHDRANLFQEVFEASAFFGDQRRVRGDAIEHAPTCRLFNLFCIAGIQEKHHGKHLPCIG